MHKLDTEANFMHLKISISIYQKNIVEIFPFSLFDHY